MIGTRGDLYDYENTLQPYCSSGLCRRSGSGYDRMSVQSSTTGAQSTSLSVPSQLWARDAQGRIIRTSCAELKASFQDEQMSNQPLYRNAVKDALTVEPEELLPLVSLNRGDPMVTFDEQGRVLLLTVHAFPDSYPQDRDMKLQYQCWTFTDKEFAAWFAVSDHDVTDWSVRVNQMLGMPADRRSTHVTAMWVNPDDVIRPAYRSDVHNSRPADSFATVHAELESQKKADKTAVAAGLHGSMHDPIIFENWFNSRIIASYFSQKDYPWTRLGYTYDWLHAVRSDGHNGSCEYGVSEFLVPVDTKVKVAWTMPLADFITRVRALTTAAPDGSAAPSAAAAAASADAAAAAAPAASPETQAPAPAAEPQADTKSESGTAAPAAKPQA